MAAKRKGARARLRDHFLSNIGRIMDSGELREASGGISEWARRIRELRDEEGFVILSHNDLSELKPGQYRLDDPKPQPAFSRDISKETRAIVLDRNGFTCQQCGAVAGEPHPYDSSRKTRLQIAHTVDKSAGGSDEPSNLRALCSVCNEGLANVKIVPPSQRDLLVQIRRATVNDQRVVLEWLRRKFPKD